MWRFLYSRCRRPRKTLVFFEGLNGFVGLIELEICRAQAIVNALILRGYFLKGFQFLHSLQHPFFGSAFAFSHFKKDVGEKPMWIRILGIKASGRLSRIDGRSDIPSFPQKNSGFYMDSGAVGIIFRCQPHFRERFAEISVVFKPLR